jgi:hypothetical protein
MFFLLLLCCCFGGLGFAAYYFMFMNKKRKPNKKNKQKKNKFAAEDQVPLVQEEAPHFGGSETTAQEQRTAMAPTYTGLTPQMGQAAMTAQMPTHTHMSGQQQFGSQQQALQMQQAAIPTQTAMMGQTGGQTAAQTSSWSPGTPSPGQRDAFVAAQSSMQTMVLEQPPAMQQASMQTMVLEQPPAMQQASMQTMVLEQPPGALQSGQGSYAMGTQAAFPSAGLYQQPQQEMELVTITPDGYSVTPLAAGQGVPTGVPVFGQLPHN